MASNTFKICAGSIIGALFISAFVDAMGREPHAQAAQSEDDMSQNVAIDEATGDLVLEKSRKVLVAEQPQLRSTPTRSVNDYPIVRQATSMSQKGDGVGMLLNLGGELCAKVLNTRHLRGDSFLVTCREYRTGSGTVSYRFNASNGSSVRL